MLAGELYRGDDPELIGDKARCAQLLEEYNATSLSDSEWRSELLLRLLGAVGRDVRIWSPVFFVYGYQTTIGDGAFINTGAVILDVGRVTIGDDVLIGPNVQLLTPIHPMEASVRREGWEAQKPITIADGVWLGGGVIVCGGVTIGENSVVGAGSVVTRDIPPHVFAAGNPCRVIRVLSE